MGGLLPLVLYLALLQCHAGEGLLKTSSACFGKKEASCAHLNTTCSGQEKVFVVTAQYGSKPCDTCLSEVADSTHCRKNCCRAMARDCFMNYTARDFQTLFLTCKEGDDCVAPSKRNASSCGTVSNFVSVSYVCIKDTNVRQVEVGSSARFSAGAAAAVRFSQGQQWNSSSSGEWRCLVESRPGSSSGGSTELLLVRGPGSSGGGPGAVDRARETTPFYINLSVLQGPETWAVMYASERSSLQVTCGSSDTTVSSVTSDTPDSSVTSDTPDSSVTSVTPDFSTTSSAPVSSAASDTTGSSAGTIAAAVISVLVLLAVAGVIALVLMRRRGIKPSSLLSRLPRLKGGNSSQPARSPRPVKKVEISAPVVQDQRRSTDPKHQDDVENGEYFTIDNVDGAYVTIGDVDGDRPTVEGTDSTDYHRLGENKMASAPSRPRNPYGQLGATSVGNDITEYNYNHLAQGNRSDVIAGNDYDMVRPPAGPETDNSGYDVAVVKGDNRVEVLHSPYELARPLTEAGVEGGDGGGN